jgi:putative phosphoesterase
MGSAATVAPAVIGVKLALMSTSQYARLPELKMPCRVAVLSDTHVPDRQAHLPATLLDLLKGQKPDHIFHCGDISTPEVIKDLENIAPLTAVLGNRDFIFRMDLPLEACFEIGGVKVAVTHGQGSAWRYFTDKIKYLSTGYDFERYRRYFDTDYPEADLVIFGHTHTPVNVLINERRYFNSGATYPCSANDFKPRIGWLEFSCAGQYSTRFIEF